MFDIEWTHVKVRINDMEFCHVESWLALFMWPHVALVAMFLLGWRSEAKNVMKNHHQFFNLESCTSCWSNSSIYLFTWPLRLFGYTRHSLSKTSWVYCWFLWEVFCTDRLKTNQGFLPRKCRPLRVRSLLVFKTLIPKKFKQSTDLYVSDICWMTCHWIVWFRSSAQSVFFDIGGKTKSVA